MIQKRPGRNVRAFGLMSEGVVHHQGQSQRQAPGQAVQADPLLPGVGQGPGHRADGVGGNPQGKGDVAVGGVGTAVGGLASKGLDDFTVPGGEPGQGLRVHRAVAGADPQQLHLEGTAPVFPPGEHLPELLLHHRQVLLGSGAELIEDGGLLGDGVDGGAAFDAAHVVGGPGGGLDLVEVIHQPAHQPDGAGAAEVGIGVAPLGAAGDFVPPGAHRCVAAQGHVEVKGIKGLDLPRVGGEEGFGAGQVPQPLLAGVGHNQHPLAEAALVPDQPAGRQQQVDQVGGVVPDAGGKEPARLFPQGQGLLVGKDDVGVGGKHHIGSAPGGAQAADHVFGAVDRHVPGPLGLEPVPAEGGPAVLLMGGGRYLAQCPQQSGLFLPAGCGVLLCLCALCSCHGLVPP